MSKWQPIEKDFVSDRSVYVLRHRYPDMFEFYEKSIDWVRTSRQGWEADKGTDGYFEHMRESAK